MKNSTFVFALLCGFAFCFSNCTSTTENDKQITELHRLYPLFKNASGRHIAYREVISRVCDTKVKFIQNHKGMPIEDIKHYVSYFDRLTATFEDSAKHYEGLQDSIHSQIMQLRISEQEKTL